MSTLFNVLWALHAVVSIGLVGLILMQRGKGADAGASFGAGASGTVFGARGSANFLSRATAMLAVVFFANCLALAYLATQRTGGGSVTDSLELPAEAAQLPDITPALPGAADVPELDAPEDADDALEDVPAFSDNPPTQEESAPADETMPEGEDTP